MSDLTSEYDANELREVVRSLVSGMSLARVPEELHPQLLIPLSAAKNEALVAGNATTVKRIQGLLHDLKLNPGRPGPPLTSTLASARSTFITTRSRLEERRDDLELTIDELLDGRAIESVGDDVIPSLIAAMKDRKQVFIAQGEYRKTQQLENLIQAANARFYDANYHSMQSTKLAAMRVQLVQAKSELEAAELFWRDAKARQDEEYAAGLEDLEEEQRMQLEDYDTSFPEVLPANYRKLSTRVLQLRDQERHLVLAKRYEDAIPYREMADRLESEELEEQRQRFLKNFQAQRQQLVESQVGQRRCFERNWERKWERFEKERDHELSVLQRAITNLESKIRGIEDDGEPKTGQSGKGSSVLTKAAQIGSRGNSRLSSASVNSRVRNIAASRLAQRRSLMRKFGR